RTLSGGNPNLSPESADTYTFGVVWTPDFTDSDLRMAVDWFSYEIEDKIGGVPAASIISRCYNDQGANPNYELSNLWCSFFERSSAGIAENVQSIDQNLGKNNIEGVDLQLDYGRDIG